MSKFIGFFGDTTKYTYQNPDSGKKSRLTEDHILILIRKALEKIEKIKNIGEESNDHEVYFVIEQNHDPMTELVFNYAMKRGIKTVSLYNKNDSKDLKLIHKTTYHRGYTTATKYKVIFENIDAYVNIGNPRDSFDFVDSYNCPFIDLTPQDILSTSVGE